MNTDNLISIDDFEKVNMCVGTVIAAEVFPKAKKPAYKLTIDFGPLGLRKSSAQITALYTPEALVGKQVVAVLNFPAKQIADFMSDCLVLGAVSANKEVVLLTTERDVDNGLRIA
jgi:tRNA-binding protein